MKSPLRASILLLAAAVSLPFAYGQNAPPQDPAQGQGPGMGGVFAGHGVRGTVTAISGNDISVKTEKGDVYKIETGPNTRFRKEREQVKISDIHVGDMVGAAGDLDDKDKTVGAVVVMVIDKEQYEKARADFGKTWTAGAIQSIDETKITIKRPDNVVQTIVVDENTSFRKRRDSITLADIKVGDNVNARGAVQNGNFVATVLNVAGPGGPGGFRGGGGSQGGTNAQSAPGSTNPAPPKQ